MEAAKISTEVTDPKAGTTFSNFWLNGSVLLFTPELFYDGAMPPPGIFDGIFLIPALSSEVQTQSYLSSLMSQDSSPGLFYSVPIEKASTCIFEAILNEMIFWGKELTLKGHATSPRAYPPIINPGILPFNNFYGWTDTVFDDNFCDAMRQSPAQRRRVSIVDGQIGVIGAPKYPKYALFDTPLEDMYGENAPKL
ncbi:hypothetical protein M422DRAFT_264638 [Sphaerobolus stellatus SS14]|uniref:Uncharacterized protein n=1 Tax=Sphaerobolus stellatus (strain SS14) TaxID=990650 RepID=A0A0C9V7R1_SPHS4|nr:hypothetical protein M422DRAFT_264638 [Sphaerobolus stellatus SS14]